MRKIIENYCVNQLYLLGFNNFGRLNKKRKRIIFNWNGAPIFRMFTQKKNYVIWVLITFCGYTVYEEQLNFLKPYKQKIKHSWGEIQDIIRAYNTIPSIKLSRLVSNQYSSEPKSDVLPVTPQDN